MASGRVNHIVFMMQEHCSFDAYVGKLNNSRALAFGQHRDAGDICD
jgi:phospholipase C